LRFFRVCDMVLALCIDIFHVFTNILHDIDILEHSNWQRGFWQCSNFSAIISLAFTHPPNKTNKQISTALCNVMELVIALSKPQPTNHINGSVVYLSAREYRSTPNRVLESLRYVLTSKLHTTSGLIVPGELARRQSAAYHRNILTNAHLFSQVEFNGDRPGSPARASSFRPENRASSGAAGGHRT
jgi:hypothetical protein